MPDKKLMDDHSFSLPRLQGLLAVSDKKINGRSLILSSLPPSLLPSLLPSLPRLQGLLAVSDKPRPEAARTVAALHRMGIQVGR